MKKIKVECVGVSPILMNPATDELLDELFYGAAARKPKDPDRTPEQEAAKKVIKNEEGKVGIPAQYLFSSLVEAGRLIKIDAKRSISTKESTLLPSFLSIEEFFLPFVDQSVNYHVDKRKGTIPNADIAVCIIRPRFDKWSFTATLLIDEKEVNEDKVKQLVEKAGTAIGLGDFRPACRGQFGRFKIAKWENGQ